MNDMCGGQTAKNVLEKRWTGQQRERKWRRVLKKML